MQHVFPSNWFLLLFLKFIHVVACVNISFLLWLNSSSLYKYLSIHHLSFPFLAIVTSTAVNIHLQAFVQACFQFPWEYS